MSAARRGGRGGAKAPSEAGGSREPEASPERRLQRGVWAAAKGCGSRRGRLGARPPCHPQGSPDRQSGEGGQEGVVIEFKELAGWFFGKPFRPPGLS